MKLVLYTTDHCSLCERALDLLLSMPESRGHSLVVLDVIESADLLERYGARLPVLAVAGAELDWPFDRAAVSAAMDRAAGA